MKLLVLICLIATFVALASTHCRAGGCNYGYDIVANFYAVVPQGVDVCEPGSGAACRVIPVPGCSNCSIRFCIGAASTECIVPKMVYTTGSHTYECGERDIFSVFCRPTGTSAAQGEACDAIGTGCPTCPAHWHPDWLEDWLDKEWTDMYAFSVTCNCP